MDARGAAPALTCPRCGSESVPQGAPLVTCARCKLTFDANPDRQRAMPRPPRDEPMLELVSQQVPPGMVVVRETHALEVRVARDRIGGFFWLSVALILAWALQYAYSDITNLIYYAVLVGLGYTGLAKLIGSRVLRIADGTLSSRLRPLPLPPMTRLSLDTVQQIELGASARTRVSVVALLTDGGVQELFAVEGSPKHVTDDAGFVASTLQTALEASRTKR